LFQWSGTGHCKSLCLIIYIGHDFPINLKSILVTLGVISLEGGEERLGKFRANQACITSIRQIFFKGEI
jgi:hypothetical protein